MSRYRPLADITQLIVHCAATPNGAPFTAADIDRWHGERGFQRAPDAQLGAGRWSGLGLHAPALAHIGYHYVIRINGVVEVGRRLTETGAHCRGQNHNSIGVCLVGTDQFTPAQWRALRFLVAAERRDRTKQRLPPISLHGHRVYNQRKTCPGFDVAAWERAGFATPPGAVLELPA
jgi:hypothetical protein